MSVLAVNHHYYRETAPKSGIYPVNRETLLLRVKKLKSKYKIISESDLIASIETTTTSEPSCVITFDDGLKEQMLAVEDLSKNGFESICFVPTKPIVENTVLDVHKLHMVRSVASDQEIAIDLKQFGIDEVEWDLEHLAIQYRYDSVPSRKVKYFLNFVMAPEERAVWLDKVFTEKFGDEIAASKAIYMNREEIKLLASKGRLGTHASSHVPLANLGSDDLKKEIENSIDVLEEVGGQSIKGISYPFGGKSAVSDNVFDQSRDCGLLYGFTMERGVNQQSDLNNALKLKRIDTNDIDEVVKEDNG